MKTRIYLVTVDTGKSSPEPRLVQALTAGQAIKHVAKPMITARIPGQVELHQLAVHGVKIENAEDEGK